MSEKDDGLYTHVECKDRSRGVSTWQFKEGAESSREVFMLGAKHRRCNRPRKLSVSVARYIHAKIHATKPFHIKSKRSLEAIPEI